MHESTLGAGIPVSLTPYHVDMYVHISVYLCVCIPDYTYMYVCMYVPGLPLANICQRCVKPPTPPTPLTHH